MSSLIEPTFALESQNKNDRALAYVYYVCMQYMYCCFLHCTVQTNKHPTVFLNTEDRSAGVVFISASGFL